MFARTAPPHTTFPTELRFYSHERLPSSIFSSVIADTLHTPRNPWTNEHTDFKRYDTKMLKPRSKLSRATTKQTLPRQPAAGPCKLCTVDSVFRLLDCSSKLLSVPRLPRGRTVPADKVKHCYSQPWAPRHLPYRPLAPPSRLLTSILSTQRRKRGMDNGYNESSSHIAIPRSFSTAHSEAVRAELPMVERGRWLECYNLQLGLQIVSAPSDCGLPAGELRVCYTCACRPRRSRNSHT